MIYLPIRKSCETIVRNFDFNFFGNFLNFKFGLGLWHSSIELSRSTGLSRLSRRMGISVTPTGVEWMPSEFVLEF